MKIDRTEYDRLLSLLCNKEELQQLKEDINKEVLKRIEKIESLSNKKEVPRHNTRLPKRLLT